MNGGEYFVRFPALLLFIWLAAPPVQAQGRNPQSSDYGPTQVLDTMRQLREQQGGSKPPRLAVCLKNSSGGRWSDLQAHFYCWLKADQRACFTGAVDGEFKEHPELKGNYDMAFGYCQEAKGRAYGINFDRPLARLSPQQSDVFKNLIYRQPKFSQDEQRKILETFYAGPVPERKPFPAPVPPPPPPPPPPVMVATMANPDIGEETNAVPNERYPRSCRVNSSNARTRQKPDSNSPIVAILQPTPIKVTGPAQDSSDTDTTPWYPVEFPYRGKLVNAWLSVPMIDCPK